MKNTLEELIEYLKAEVAEAEEVIDDREKLATELPDIILFVFAIANIQGIDLEVETYKKLERNFLKYSAAELQDGDYQEKRKELREWWSLNGNDNL